MNLLSTPLILRAGAASMHRCGAPVHVVGRMLVLADLAQSAPEQFGRVVSGVLTALPDEPVSPTPSHNEQAAYDAVFK